REEPALMLLGWGCTAGPWGVKAQQPGTPLSDQEYRQFFRSLRAARGASTACLLRALYGCQNPLVQTLDKYENHGVIPEASSHTLGHGDDQEAVEFLTKVQGGTRMAWGFS
uniref:Acrosin-binding protein n=1 Tax=Strix occidentalis caurina TaxID=311401 RepID=A0A8D0FBL3_STROC